MKIKTKMAIATTAIAFTSLMIMAYHIEPTTSPVSPQIASASEVVEVGRDYTLPPATEAIVAQKIAETGTQKEETTTPTNQKEDVSNAEETPQPQPTEKEEMTNTPTAPAQTATKPVTPPSSELTTPKNGDVRFIDGQQQGYLIGFGWVDYMGENECIFEEGMYENGNKIGIMGDINKIVGVMDYGKSRCGTKYPTSTFTIWLSISQEPNQNPNKPSSTC